MTSCYVCNLISAFAYLSVEVEIAKYHEHSTDFSEQRPEDKCEAKGE